MDRIKETDSERRKRKALEKREEKKRRIKALFDSEYDEKGTGKTHYDQLKEELEQQAQVRRFERVL